MLSPYAAELLAERRMKDMMKEAEQERLARICQGGEKQQTGGSRVRLLFKTLQAALANSGVDRPRRPTSAGSGPNRKQATST